MTSAGVELDHTTLAGRIRASARAAGVAEEVGAIEPLPGGMSSLTYTAVLIGGTVGGTGKRVVVKVAPAGLEPVRNRDVLRQARVLWALAGAPGVRVPRVLFEDGGEPPAVPPMFAMTLVPGASDEPLDAESELPGPQAGRRARAAARMLAALHTVDPHRAGLGEEPVVGLDDELQRWATLFESVDDDLKAGAAACAERLGAAVPSPSAPVVCHGDFRLGNLLCQGNDVQAIIDWEIWSLGDRRVDLAWFLLNSDPAKPSAGRADPGLPSPAELLAEYEAGAGPVADLSWFAALVRFKQAAAMAMIVKHGRRRPPVDPRKAALAAHIRPLLDAADEVLAR